MVREMIEGQGNYSLVGIQRLSDFGFRQETEFLDFQTGSILVRLGEVFVVRRTAGRF